MGREVRLELAEAGEKYTTLPKSLWGWKPVKPPKKLGPSRLRTRLPGVPGFRRLRAQRGRGGAALAASNAGLSFPGSRRGSLRRTSARETASEAADGAASAAGLRASPCSLASPSAAAAASAGAAAATPADMAAVLQQVLERPELNKLPKATQNKLEKFLAEQQSEIDCLKGRHEKFKVESGKWGDALRAPVWSCGPTFPLCTTALSPVRCSGSSSSGSMRTGGLLLSSPRCVI